MLIEPLLGYKSTFRILNLLFETPRKPVSRKEILTHTKLGNAPLSRGLDRLTLAKIIILEKRGNKEFYYINQLNEFALILMELWKKEKQSLRHLSYDISTLLAELLRNIYDQCKEVEEVILFGSHAKGTASSHSDIDLAIIFRNNRTEELILTKITQKIERQFNQEIQIHSFTHKEFTSKTRLIEEIKSSGIYLNC